MNYIKHLTGFFEKVAIDKTLNPTHVSLYISLFQFWNCNRFKNPISINRDEVMRISKISSKATYHKCLKNLHSLGYINYEPSYNPFKGSHVILFNFSDDLKPLPKSERKPKNELLFEQVSEQALNKSCTSSGTGTEQALVPSINYINNTNISNKKNVSNLEKQAKKIIAKNEAISEDELLKNEAAEEKKEKSSAKKEKDKIKNSDLSSRAQSRELNPTTEEVKTYFKENNFPELEAQKFFNYFSSVGWLIGGKTPMVDWQAAAQNWIINSVNFNHSTDTAPTHHRQNLNATTDKNYAEPL
ncbi:transcriptional regulator [Flavobacterium sp. GSA192]|uniref:transcriptional regulator n=1 Tax=Flavobacterium sp. GSA192 TaxID=2576304 RepID=UPI0011290DCD|nr:transcriptional regulator [Flavobacterium sp. GSA192]